MAENNGTGHGQTVDFATKSNNLYSGDTNVPRLDRPEKLRRSSKGHVHDGSSGFGSVNNSVTNNDVSSDDGDLISGHHAPDVGRVPSTSSRSGGGGLRNGGDSSWSGIQSSVLSNNSGRSAEATMVAA